MKMAGYNLFENFKLGQLLQVQDYGLTKSKSGQVGWGMDGCTSFLQLKNSSLPCFLPQKLKQIYIDVLLFLEDSY